jgi:hypothetical protein
VRCTFPEFTGITPSANDMTMTAVSADFRPASEQKAIVMVEDTTVQFGEATIATDGTMVIQSGFPPAAFGSTSNGLVFNTIVWSVG